MDANDWSSRNYLLCSVVYVDYKGKEKSDSGRCDGLDVTNMTNRYRLHSAQSAVSTVRNKGKAEKRWPGRTSPKAGQAGKNFVRKILTGEQGGFSFELLPFELLFVCTIFRLNYCSFELLS